MPSSMNVINLKSDYRWQRESLSKKEYDATLRLHCLFPKFTRTCILLTSEFKNSRFSSIRKIPSHPQDSHFIQTLNRVSLRGHQIVMRSYHRRWREAYPAVFAVVFATITATVAAKLLDVSHHVPYDSRVYPIGSTDHWAPFKSLALSYVNETPTTSGTFSSIWSLRTPNAPAHSPETPDYRLCHGTRARLVRVQTPLRFSCRYRSRRFGRHCCHRQLVLRNNPTQSVLRHSSSSFSIASCARRSHVSNRPFRTHPLLLYISL